MPFGSIITGLGIKSSDVDCYVEVPSWVLNTERSVVLKAKYILMKRRDIFDQLFAIINAKVPIVKFFHVPTERHCDISFTSFMGVQNSKLIAYLLHLDERFLKLTVLIKYWSKVHKFTGTNLLANYCLTMLVIFFLQQKHILPAVSELQNGPELYIDGWNAAFSEVPYVNNNKETLYQLIGGFFKYYHKFKFNDFIISPFVGQPIAKELFVRTDTVPMLFNIYKSCVGSGQCQPLRLDSFMCVQDPIEHNRNCSVAVHPKLAQKILSHFATAVNIYEQNDEKSFLRQLLSISESTEVKKKKAKKPKRKQPVINNGISKHKNGTRNFYLNFKNKQKSFKNKPHRSWK